MLYVYTIDVVAPSLFHQKHHFTVKDYVMPSLIIVASKVVNDTNT